MSYRDLSPSDDYTIRPGDYARVIGLDEYLTPGENILIAKVNEQLPDGEWSIGLECFCCSLPHVKIEQLIKVIPEEENETTKRNFLQNILLFLSQKGRMLIK